MGEEEEEEVEEEEEERQKQVELVEEVQGACEEDFWERKSESLWEDGENEKGKKREKRMEHGENAKNGFSHDVDVATSGREQMRHLMTCRTCRQKDGKQLGAAEC